MANLVLGKAQQLSFADDHEYNLRFTRYGKKEAKKKSNTSQTSSFSCTITQSSFSRTEKTKLTVSQPVYTAPKPEPIPVSVKKGKS